MTTSLQTTRLRRSRPWTCAKYGKKRRRPTSHAFRHVNRYANRHVFTDTLDMRLGMCLDMLGEYGWPEKNTSQTLRPWVPLGSHGYAYFPCIPCVHAVHAYRAHHDYCAHRAHRAHRAFHDYCAHRGPPCQPWLKALFTGRVQALECLAPANAQSMHPSFSHFLKKYLYPCPSACLHAGHCRGPRSRGQLQCKQR